MKDSKLSGKSDSELVNEKYDDENITKEDLIYILRNLARNTSFLTLATPRNIKTKIHEPMVVHLKAHDLWKNWAILRNFYKIRLQPLWSQKSGTQSLLWKRFTYARNKELDTLIESKTLASNQPPFVELETLPSMIIIKQKKGGKRTLEKFRARHVAIGSIKNENCVLIELYAPVIWIDLVRALFAVVQVKEWFIRHVAFKRAFLNVYLKEKNKFGLKLRNIYGTKFVGLLVKLDKYLYGLRQASKLLYHCLYFQLIKLRLKRSSEIGPLFLLLSSATNVVLIHVDDILIWEDLGGKKTGWRCSKKAPTDIHYNGFGKTDKLHWFKYVLRIGRNIFIAEDVNLQSNSNSCNRKF